ncbi:MAG TPA: precorrin-3B C(17)-methyltransferase [Actinocrinis sp.]|jgi:cobalt-precorrin 5A hydrolase/precorrin-3B C17-methyltransferase
MDQISEPDADGRTGPAAAPRGADRPIGLVAVTAAGRAAAAALCAAWGDEVRLFTGDGEPGSPDASPAADALCAAFAACRAVVSFLAVGATIRVLAPHLRSKTSDPAVVCVDEARRFAIALLGGHRGANALAERVADALGARPVVTTASDSVGAAALDSLGADLGFVLESPELLPRFGVRMLSGDRIEACGLHRWPLPALPASVVPAAQSPDQSSWPDEDPVILVSDLDPPFDADRAANGTPVPVLVYRPPSLVVGVGSSRGVSADEVLATVDAALAAGGLSAASVSHLASIDLKADEAGLCEAAERRGWTLVFHPAAALAPIPVPNPSPRVEEETGSPSVAEAAARFAGIGRPLSDLVVEKVKSARNVPMATAAVARLRPRGRLALIGLGPGARDLLTPRAVEELRRASVVVGLDQYVAQVEDLLRPGTEIAASGLGAEEERARTAVYLARTGRAVALVGSGDAGIYAMASPALDQVVADDIDVVCVPGITAAAAAAGLLGAPLGHDHCAISLSDLHTPWPAIERRVRAAAEGDFVVCFYNPRSRQRDWQLGAALGILAGHRPAQTPVGWVRNASRPDESVGVSTLADFDPALADMYTVVVVGSSQSRLVAGRFVTPRGYEWSQ